jgi:hypothetical protein
MPNAVEDFGEIDRGIWSAEKKPLKRGFILEGPVWSGDSGARRDSIHTQRHAAHHHASQPAFSDTSKLPAGRKRHGFVICVFFTTDQQQICSVSLCCS